MERFVKYAEKFSSQEYFYKMSLLTEPYSRDTLGQEGNPCTLGASWKS